MKKLSSFIIAILLSLAAVAQPPTEATVNKIELSLDKMHRQYRTGTVFTTIGMALVFGGVASIASDNSQTGLLYAGGILMTIGGVIHIDSHKFLSKKRKP